jgi:hypothetical protein
MLTEALVLVLLLVACTMWCCCLLPFYFCHIGHCHCSHCAVCFSHTSNSLPLLPFVPPTVRAGTLRRLCLPHIFLVSSSLPLLLSSVSSSLPLPLPWCYASASAYDIESRFLFCAHIQSSNGSGPTVFRRMMVPNQECRKRMLTSQPCWVWERTTSKSWALRWAIVPKFCKASPVRQAQFNSFSPMSSTRTRPLSILFNRSSITLQLLFRHTSISLSITLQPLFNHTSNPSIALFSLQPLYPSTMTLFAFCFSSFRCER